MDYILPDFMIMYSSCYLTKTFHQKFSYQKSVLNFDPYIPRLFVEFYIKLLRCKFIYVQGDLPEPLHNFTRSYYGIKFSRLSNILYAHKIRLTRPVTLL